MELSLAFIASRLRRRYPVSLRGADGFFRQIDNPRHIAGSPKFKTARLFVPAKLAGCDCKILSIVRSDVEDAERIPGHVDGIVWVGNFEPPKDIDVLWISTAADVLVLADDILNIFEEVNDWIEQVTNMLLAHRPVPNVVAKLAEVTDSPFWLADGSLHVLFMSKDPELEQASAKWRHQAETGRYSAEVIGKLVANGDLALINSKQRAWLYEPADGMTYDIPFVSKAIALKGSIYGYIFIIERMPGYVARDLEIAETLGELIATYVQHGMPTSPTGKRYTEQLLRSCLAGDRVSHEERMELLNLLGWKDSEGFYVAVFDRGSARHGDEAAPEAQVNLVSTRFPGGRAFGYDVYIVLVGTTVKDEREKTLADLHDTCEELGWKCGASFEFFDFAQLDSHYGQAQIALRKGSADDPKELVYLYSRYQVPYLCQMLVENVDRGLLMHPDVEQLIVYDAENDSELVKTLGVYLQNERNVSQTAKELYLHRNSVNYRIKKIESLISADLDDPESRLSLQISTEIWQLQPWRFEHHARRNRLRGD